MTVYKKDDQFLVEFHRCRGCAFGFMSMYRRVVRNASHLCLSHEDVPEEEESSPLNNQDLAVVLDKSDDSLTSWSPLLDMANSPYVDVVCEGLCALAQLSATQSNAQAICVKSKALINVCEKALLLPNDKAQRLAATVLANIAQFECTARDQLTEVSLFSRVLCDTRNAEAERQLARLLNHLSKTHCDFFEQQALDNMEKACAKADARAQALLYSALSYVNSGSCVSAQ